jgi:hypothetical protein
MFVIELIYNMSDDPVGVVNELSVKNCAALEEKLIDIDGRLTDDNFIEFGAPACGSTSSA